MRATSISINLFSVLFLSVAALLGFLGLVSWYVILLIVLSQFELNIKFKL